MTFTLPLLFPWEELDHFKNIHFQKWKQKVKTKIDQTSAEKKNLLLVDEVHQHKKLLNNIVIHLQVHNMKIHGDWLQTKSMLT